MKTKLIRYAATGLATFVIEYSLFIFLVYGLKLAPWLGQSVSYVAALIANFLLLKYWTFQEEKSTKVISQAPKYATLVLFNLPVTTLLMHILTVHHLKPFLAKLVVVGLAATWNYVIYEKIIFKSSGQEFIGDS